MAEVGTGLTALAIALGGKELFVKMLGPLLNIWGNREKIIHKRKLKTFLEFLLVPRNT